MSPDGIIERGAAFRFPRVSGDEPPYYRMWDRDEAFSPRERG